MYIKSTSQVIGQAGKAILVPLLECRWTFRFESQLILFDETGTATGNINRKYISNGCVFGSTWVAKRIDWRSYGLLSFDSVYSGPQIDRNGFQLFFVVIMVYWKNHADSGWDWHACGAMLLINQWDLWSLSRRWTPASHGGGDWMLLSLLGYYRVPVQKGWYLKWKVSRWTWREIIIDLTWSNHCCYCKNCVFWMWGAAAKCIGCFPCLCPCLSLKQMHKICWRRVGGWVE